VSGVDVSSEGDGIWCYQQANGFVRWDGNSNSFVSFELLRLSRHWFQTDTSAQALQVFHSTREHCSTGTSVMQRFCGFRGAENRADPENTLAVLGPDLFTLKCHQQDQAPSINASHWSIVQRSL
jgi:hypothetical protein